MQGVGNIAISTDIAVGLYLKQPYEIIPQLQQRGGWIINRKIDRVPVTSLGSHRYTINNRVTFDNLSST